MPTDAADPPPAPDSSLDGAIAAPDHHRVLFENDRVRVLETLVRAGDTTPVHTHLPPTVLYVLSGSHFIRRDPDGAVLLDTSRLEPARAAVLNADRALVGRQPGPHAREHGQRRSPVIGVELKG